MKNPIKLLIKVLNAGFAKIERWSDETLAPKPEQERWRLGEQESGAEGGGRRGERNQGKETKEGGEIGEETAGRAGEWRQGGEKKEVHSVWDYLKFNEHTQAFHLSSVLNFEEWLDMEEITRRIEELFHVNYKNSKSLYPYIKTLTDAGLLEMNSIGGRRKWRKKALIIEVKESKGEKEKNKVRKEESAVENKG